MLETTVNQKINEHGKMEEVISIKCGELQISIERSACEDSTLRVFAWGKGMDTRLLVMPRSSNQIDLTLK